MTGLHGALFKDASLVAGRTRETEDVMLGDLEVCVVVRETVTLTFQVAPQNIPTITAESSTIMMKQIRMKVEGRVMEL